MISIHILILKRYPVISLHILEYPYISLHILRYPRGQTPIWYLTCCLHSCTLLAWSTQLPCWGQHLARAATVAVQRRAAAVAQHINFFAEAPRRRGLICCEYCAGAVWLLPPSWHCGTHFHVTSELALWHSLCTSTHIHLLVCSSMYWYELVWTSTYYHYVQVHTSDLMCVRRYKEVQSLVPWCTFMYLLIQGCRTFGTSLYCLVQWCIH